VKTDPKRNHKRKGGNGRGSSRKRAGGFQEMSRFLVFQRFLPLLSFLLNSLDQTIMGGGKSKYLNLKEQV